MTPNHEKENGGRAFEIFFSSLSVSFSTQISAFYQFKNSELMVGDESARPRHTT